MCAAMQNIVDMMKVITVVRSLAYIQNIQGMAWVIPHKPRLHHREGIRDCRHTTRQTTKTNIHKPTCITWILYHLSLSLPTCSLHSSLTVLIFVWALPSFFSLSLFCDQALIASFSCCTDTFSWFLIWKSWSVFAGAGVELHLFVELYYQHIYDRVYFSWHNHIFFIGSLTTNKQTNKNNDNTDNSNNKKETWTWTYIVLKQLYTLHKWNQGYYS